MFYIITQILNFIYLILNRFYLLVGYILVKFDLCT